MDAVSINKLTVGIKLIANWNNKDKIDYYQNVGTKLTVTAKCRDQNDVSSLYINRVTNRSYVYNKKKKKKSSKVNIIGKKKKS